MGADVHVLGVELPVRDVRHEPRAEPVVVRLADLVVDLAPPDLGLAPGLADDELVLRRAAGVLAGTDDERALGRDLALARADGALVQLGGGKVGQDAAPDRGGGGGTRHGHDRVLDCSAGVQPAGTHVTGRA